MEESKKEEILEEGEETLEQPIDDNGNSYVILENEKGEKKRVEVCVLVLESFGFMKPSKNHEVKHKDGDKTNNKLENLEWVLEVSPD